MNKIFEEYSVRIYEIDPYFFEHHKEKIKIDVNGCKYILFRTDVYFTEYFLAVKFDEQNRESRVLILKRKYKRYQKKNLVAYLLELIQMTQKEGYDADYKVSRMQLFISKFIEKKRKRKEKVNKIK